MGYRSSVTFATTEEGYDRMIRECDKLNEERGIEYPILGSNQEPETLYREEGCIVFGWPDEKWYNTYGSVKVIEDAYEAFKELDFPAERLIIGEEWSDVEYENSYGDPRLKVHIEPRCEVAVVIGA